MPRRTLVEAYEDVFFRFRHEPSLRIRGRCSILDARSIARLPHDNMVRDDDLVASNIQHPLIDRTDLEPPALIVQGTSLFYSTEISSMSKTNIPAGAPGAPL